MSPFWRILQYAKPYKRFFGLNILFNILYALMANISLFSILPILKILFNNIKPEDVIIEQEPKGIMSSFENFQSTLTQWIAEQMVVHGQLTVLAWLCGVTVLLFFFRNLFRYLASYYMVGFRTGTTKDIRNALYDKVLSLPVSFFTEQRKGDIMTRISSDVDNLQRYSLIPLIEFFRAPFMIVIALALLIFINWQLTLAAFVILPVMGLIISLISKSLKKDTKITQHMRVVLISCVDETLSADKFVKIFNAEKNLSDRFKENSTEWRAMTNKVERKHELASPSSELLGSFTLIMLVWFGGKFIIEGNGGSLQGETFLIFLGLFFQMLDPAKGLSKAFADTSRGSASAERVLEVLDADIVVKEKENPKIIKSFNNQIEFRNVGFEYVPDQPVLSNINLIIPKGQAVAFVGQSGSGKTTIANLLARFYDVTEGEILIDGINIKELSLDSYRQLIGMVTQESVLFNDTILNNIALGQETVNEIAVEEASIIANAHEFIEKLPKGYHENIGESGGKLSGGQKQRISIARAVLKNPPIMILDEATSALDSKSERLVQDALNQMMINRTSLIIAHRLSTIQNADKIIVMENGAIQEVGNHHELIEMDGIYARLIEMQNFE